MFTATVLKMMSCKRCGSKFSCKSQLLNHLKRKTVCEVTVEDISPSEYVNLLNITLYNEVTFDCKRCKKKFNNYKTCWSHCMTCKPTVAEITAELKKTKDEHERTNDVKDKKIAALERRIKELLANKSQEPFLTIHAFGMEDMAFITQDTNFDAFMKGCVDSKIDGVITFLIRKHFDSLQTANHNIRKSHDESMIDVRNEDVWIKRDKDDVLYELLSNIGKTFEPYVIKSLSNKHMQRAKVEAYWTEVASPMDWSLMCDEYEDFADESKEKIKIRREAICKDVMKCIVEQSKLHH